MILQNIYIVSRLSSTSQITILTKYYAKLTFFCLLISVGRVNAGTSYVTQAWVALIGTYSMGLKRGDVLHRVCFSIGVNYVCEQCGGGTS